MIGKDVDVERTRFATRDRAAAAAFIDKMYISHRPLYRESRGGGEFRATMASVHQIGCDRVQNHSHVLACLDPVDYVAAVQSLRGRMLVRSRTDEARLRAGDSLMYPLGEPVTVEWDDIDIIVLRLSMSRLSKVAGELTGVVPAELRFASMLPVSPAMNRYWRATVGFLNRELTADESALVEPLVAEQMLRMLTVAALATFPNSTMTLDRPPAGGQPSSAALRRAVAYIDDNAHRPISLADIAGASRVGARALQQAFARHYAVSPVAYLRRVRLDRAHRELQAADPGSGATVAAIAARWGFAKPGRFASDYRDTYGQLPSRTLRS